MTTRIGKQIGVIDGNDAVRFDGSLGLLEVSIVYYGAAREIQRRTGMDPDTFFKGMRELFAPAAPVVHGPRGQQ